MKEKKVIGFLIGVIMLVVIIDGFIILYSKNKLKEKETKNSSNELLEKDKVFKYICKGNRDLENQTFPKILSNYEFYFTSKNGVESGQVVYEILFDNIEHYNAFDYSSLNPSNVLSTSEEDEKNLKKKLTVSIMYEYGKKNIDEVIKNLQKINYTDCKME